MSIIKQSIYFSDSVKQGESVEIGFKWRKGSILNLYEPKSAYPIKTRWDQYLCDATAKILMNCAEKF